jgi:hypothetical protein
LPQSAPFMFCEFEVRNVDNVNPRPSQKTVPANVLGVARRLSAIYLDSYQVVGVPIVVVVAVIWCA